MRLFPRALGRRVLPLCATPSRAGLEIDKVTWRVAQKTGAVSGSAATCARTRSDTRGAGWRCEDERRQYGVRIGVRRRSRRRGRGARTSRPRWGTRAATRSRTPTTGGARAGSGGWRCRPSSRGPRSSQSGADEGTKPPPPASTSLAPLADPRCAPVDRSEQDYLAGGPRQSAPREQAAEPSRRVDGAGPTAEVGTAPPAPGPRA